MTRLNWASSAMLMCLLATDTVLAYPKPGEPDESSWLTQFPPAPTNGRVLLQQDQGVSWSYNNNCYKSGAKVLYKVLPKGPRW